MLGHDDVSGNNKIVLGPHLLQDIQEDRAPADRVEELLAPVTAAGDEVPVTGMVESPETFRHDRSL